MEQAVLNCEMVFRATHKCSAWPPMDVVGDVVPWVRNKIERTVDGIMRGLRFQGVKEGRLASLLRRPCIQRLCLHVQLINGKMFVVAPTGMRTCLRNGSLRTRLSCPPHRRSWAEDMADECRKVSRNQSANDRSIFCNSSHRQQQPGVTIPNYWNDFIYPLTLEWNFAAGLNLSSCKAEGEKVPLPGDYNHVYTRLRLQSMLRLLLRTYERLHASGTLTQPVELIICPNETPVNLGDWCVSGAQPIFSSTSNEDASVIPFVQWIQAADRDSDLAYYSPTQSRESPTSLAKGISAAWSAPKRAASWASKEPKAVFRGSLHRFSVYSDRWREQRPRRTPVNSSNWRSLGRTSLLAIKVRAPNLLNVRLSMRSVEAGKEGLASALKIDDTAWTMMDTPDYLPMSEQAARFKYALQVEGHGGWADRGYKLLLGQQLVFVQDTPAQPWYQRFLTPYEHYVPVHSTLGNLTEAILWARAHDDEAQRIVARANVLVRELLRPRAIFRYAEEVLLGYARLLRYKPTLHERAIRFNCEDHVGSRRSCRLKRPWSGTYEKVRLGDSSCFFVGKHDEARYNTLFEASLDRRHPEGSDELGPGHSPNVLQAMEEPNGFTREMRG